MKRSEALELFKEQKQYYGYKFCDTYLYGGLAAVGLVILYLYLTRDDE